MFLYRSKKLFPIVADVPRMYADGDIEGMRQLENTLLALNVGYKMATIQKWIIDSEE